jgi:hypothetical protein
MGITAEKMLTPEEGVNIFRGLTFWRTFKLKCFIIREGIVSGYVLIGAGFII